MRMTPFRKSYWQKKYA